MKKSRFRRLLAPLRRDDGQAAFEFMLLLPMFIIFFLLVVDFGVAMYQHISVANAVREGARYGSVNCGGGGCSVGAIRQRVVERSGGSLDSCAEVTVTWPGTPSPYQRGQSVVVSASYDHDLLFFPASWTISSSADMRLEQQDSGAGAAGTCTPP